MSALTCSSQARSLAEPLAGTASRALGYVLIEQPGSWGRKAVIESDLDPVLGGELEQRAAAAGVKVLLTRRPGPHPRIDTDRRQVALVHTGATPWMEVCDLDLAALAALDPAVCAAPTPPGRGHPEQRPRWLVCTHARRDRCCATLGRPIADTLGALHPDATWEVSHLGGHRFAGTMLVLPEGLVYGQLDVTAAMEVVTGHLAGRLDLDHLRGRSRWSRAGQLAEIAARRALGLTDVGGVELTDEGLLAPTPDGEPVQLVLDAGGRQVQVRLRAVRDPRPRPMSCDDTPEPTSLLTVEDVEVVG